MPERPRTHELEEESNRAFESHLPSRWVPRRMHPDYGLDYTVEIFGPDQRATGLSFHAQLKATDEPRLDRALGSVRFRRETADYYRSLTLPVLIVLYHAPTRQLFGRWFHAYNPHLARREGDLSEAKTIRFQFYESDLFLDETPGLIEAGLRGFLKFRSPELALPVHVAVAAAEGDDTSKAYGPTFALRRLLDPVSDLVAFEVREPAADDPCITLGVDQVVVSLADVASVTLDQGRPSEEDSEAYAADIALALSVALAYVGQANLSAQVAFAVAAKSSVIVDPEVSMTVAAAMFRSRRILEAIRLADALDSSEDEETRVAAFAFLMILLARGDHLTDDERALALATAEQRLDRRLGRGDDSGAASEAYSLAMLKKRLRDPSSAIESFRMAADLDDRYLARAYYHSDFAGVLFENGNYSEAAEHYAQAVELGEGGLTVGLHADALLYSGQYEAALDTFDKYLSEDRGPQAAEWRLKRRILPLLIETAGTEQERQPDAAAELLDSWDFERGPNISIEEAWRRCGAAVSLDACSGEAWFRLALLAIAGKEDPSDGADFAIAGAVLRRHGDASWSNAVLFSDPADESTISDLLYAGYRLCRDSLVQTLTESVRGAPHFADVADHVIELLDQAVVRVDTARRMAGFTMRFMGEAGEMNELVFGPGDETDASVPPAPTSVTWRPASSMPTRAAIANSRGAANRRKRPGKTHGKNKKRRRRRK